MRMETYSVVLINFFHSNAMICQHIKCVKIHSFLESYPRFAVQSPGCTPLRLLRCSIEIMYISPVVACGLGGQVRGSIGSMVVDFFLGTMK